MLLPVPMSVLSPWVDPNGKDEMKKRTYFVKRQRPPGLTVAMSSDFSFRGGSPSVFGEAPTPSCPE